MLWPQREKTGPIGLDLGRSHVKMLQMCNRSGEPAVAAMANVKAPRTLSAWEDHRAWYLDVIPTVLREHGFRDRQVVVALGVDEFLTKNIRLPPMPPEELASAVEFEAQDRFGFAPGTAQYRHLIAGRVRQGNEVRDEVVVFAARDEIVQKYSTLLEEMGLSPLAVDIVPCSVARCFMRFLRRAEDVESVNVFLEVGYRGSSLVVVRGAEVCFAKLIDVGGEAITQAVSQRLGLPPEEVADLRIKIMQRSTRRRSDVVPDEIPSDLVQSVADAARPVLEELAREIQLALRYFTVTFRGQRPECLTFIGGEAHEPELVSVVGAGLDLPCTIGHPLRGLGDLHNFLTPDQRSHFPGWAVAVGLALRNIPWGHVSATRHATCNVVGSEART